MMMHLFTIYDSWDFISRQSRNQEVYVCLDLISSPSQSPMAVVMSAQRMTHMQWVCVVPKEYLPLHSHKETASKTFLIFPLQGAMIFVILVQKTISVCSRRRYYLCLLRLLCKQQWVDGGKVFINVIKMNSQHCVYYTRFCQGQGEGKDKTFIEHKGKKDLFEELTWGKTQMDFQAHLY